MEREQRQALGKLRILGVRRQRQRDALRDTNAQMHEAVISAWRLGVPKKTIATTAALSRQAVYNITDNADAETA